MGRKILDKIRYICYIMVKLIVLELIIMNIDKVKSEIRYMEENTGVILNQLQGYLEHLTNYYELMRWHKLECSSEEYEKLYDKGVYSIEEHDVLERIQNVIEFLKEIK